MSFEDASDLLLEAEAQLSMATEMLVRALGSERAEEVAIGLVQDRVRTLVARKKTILALSHEAAN
jgi:hypothetical protein